MIPDPGSESDPGPDANLHASSAPSPTRATKVPISDAYGQPPEWQVAGYRHIWMPYCQMHTAAYPLAVDSTEGVYLQLSDGRRLIDGLASWWTACHGYRHPHLLHAVGEQLQHMPHVMFGGINHPSALRLATRLADLMPGNLNRVFFSDSGSVAIEVAMKMAVQYWMNRGAPQRQRFVSFHHAYHGDTTGAMSLGDPNDGMHAHFRGFLLDQFSSPLPEFDASACDAVISPWAAFDAFLEKVAPRCAAVVIEPLVQGAGGMKFHSPATLRRIAELARKHQLLLIADEIATGFGRTGTMFACEQAGVVPDIVCLSKALTGGMLGMAATVATDEVFAAFQGDSSELALMHGPTYMANPLACAAANASLDLFENEPRLVQVRAIEQQLQQELEVCRQTPGVVDVRVKGAIGVVQVSDLYDAQWWREQFVQHAVWLRPLGDVVYTMPPLTISEAELRSICSAICEVTEEWSRRFVGPAGASVTPTVMPRLDVDE